MEPDAGLEATRAIREKISRQHGNDPRRLVEYYIEHQRRFAGRLRWAPDTRAEAEDTETERVSGAVTNS